MAGRGQTGTAPRLRRLAQRRASREQGGQESGADAAQERCDLCNAPIAAEHQHLVDVASRSLMCACRPCALLFDRRAAGGGHYRLVPDRRLLVEDFELDDGSWESLRIPVDMAFFFRSTPAERVVAFYPGPMGATESLLELEAWRELERANPILEELEPDVEALLVNRTRGAREHWVVPIDDCYDLVGLIRLGWKGLSGGREVWEAIDEFFQRLRRRAKDVTRAGTAKSASQPNLAVREREEMRWAGT